MGKTTLDLDRPLEGYRPSEWDAILKKQLDEWGKVLPKACGLTPERVARLALTEFRGNGLISRCSIGSVLESLMDASELGLEIGTARHHGYLVPFKGQCTFMPGYQGLATLAMRSGVVHYIEATVVYKDELFEWERGLNPVLKHKPHLDVPPMTAATHVYAIARMKDGPDKFEVLDRRYVERIKNKAVNKAKGRYTCWGDPEQEREMWLKTAVRYLCKLLPDDTLPDALMRVWAKEDEQIHDAEFSVVEKTARSTEDLKQELDAVLDGGARESSDSDAPDDDEDFSKADDFLD